MTETSSKNDEIEQKVEWLKEKFKYSIEKYRNNRFKHKKKASFIKISTIILSGLVPILLGLQIKGTEDIFKGCALIFGAIVTMLNALEPFFNFRALWLESESLQGEFYRLNEELEYYITGTPSNKWDKNEIDRFCDIYKDIWTKYSKTWMEHRRREEKKS